MCAAPRAGIRLLVATVTPIAERAAAGLFGSLARLLGTRPLHPLGAGFEATFTALATPAAPDVPLLREPGARRAYVRFSRGFGLPDPLPEILSLAVKVVDVDGRGGDQDVLLTATGERPLLRHAFAVGRSHLRRTYSSVFLFDISGRRMLLGAVPGAGAPAPDRGDLGELEALAAAGALWLDLRVATPLGPWQPVARIDVGRRLDADEERDLRFNTDHAAGGIRPVGAINAVRGAAYAAANESRP